MMTRAEILNQISDIIIDEFEDEGLDITEETTARDVKGWDSLAHLSLMHEIERHFLIKFTMSEIQGFQNIGEMMNAIEKHLTM